MKCQELLKALSEYVEGGVDPAICKELEKHLGDCNPCRVVVDTLKKTISLYKNDEVYELPADFKQRLHKALQEKWRQKANPHSDDASAKKD